MVRWEQVEKELEVLKKRVTKDTFIGWVWTGNPSRLSACECRGKAAFGPFCGNYSCPGKVDGKCCFSGSEFAATISQIVRKTFKPMLFSKDGKDLAKPDDTYVFSYIFKGDLKELTLCSKAAICPQPFCYSGGCPGLIGGKCVWGEDKWGRNATDEVKKQLVCGVCIKRDRETPTSE